MKKIIELIAFNLICLAITFLFIYYATSKEVWYVDKHDENCEMNEHCQCYNRFIEKEN